MAFHEFEDRGDVHGIHYWTFATYADRDSHSPSEGPARLPNPADVAHKRVCLVLEDFTFHALFGFSPIEWRPLNGARETLRLAVPVGVSARDLLCSTGSLAADKADNSAPGRSPVIGMAIVMLTATSAIAVCSGIVPGFSGLTPGSDLFLGTNGGIIVPPLPSSGITVQKVGQAISESAILLDPEQPIVL